MLVSSPVHGLERAPERPRCTAKAWMGVALTTRWIGGTLESRFPLQARCPTKAVCVVDELETRAVAVVTVSNIAIAVLLLGLGRWQGPFFDFEMVLTGRKLGPTTDYYARGRASFSSGTRLFLCWK